MMYWHVRRLLPLPAAPILMCTVSFGVYVARAAAFVPSLTQHHSERSPLPPVHHHHDNGYARSATMHEGRRLRHLAYDRDGRMLTDSSKLRRRYLSSCSRRRTHSGEGDDDDQRVFWEAVEKVIKVELGDKDEHLTRVWEFIVHNRDGLHPPASLPPSYRATGLYFPGLEAKPWWDRSEFPWLAELEASAPIIIQEMHALARAGGGKSYESGTGEMSTVYDATKGWGTMRIRYMGRFGQPGVNYALIPHTLSVLRRLPLAPETAAFQRQLPGTGLPLHVDPSNFVLACHLGVVIPQPSAVTRSSLDGDVKGTRSDDGGRFRGYDEMNKVGRRRGSTDKTKISRAAGGMGFGPRSRTRSDATTSIVEGDTDVAVERKRQRNAFDTSAALGEDESRGTSNSTGGDAWRPEKCAVGRVGGGKPATAARKERAWIEVAEKRREWNMGSAFVFDPSFLHQTHNPTCGERVILNIDIWHPGLTDAEKQAIEKVCALVEQWNARSGVFE